MKKSKSKAGEEIAAKIIKGDYAAACIEHLAAAKAARAAALRYIKAIQMVEVTRKMAMEVV